LKNLSNDVEGATRRWFGRRDGDRKDLEQYNRVRDFSFAECVARELSGVA
jgi:hypothetical protein